MATRNFDGEIVIRGGEPLKNGEEPVLFRTLIVQALENDYPEEKTITGADRYKRYKLAERISKGGDIELTSEELSQIKDLTGKYFRVPVMGPIWDLLETDKSTK